MYQIKLWVKLQQTWTTVGGRGNAQEGCILEWVGGKITHKWKFPWKPNFATLKFCKDVGVDSTHHRHIIEPTEIRKDQEGL